MNSIPEQVFFLLFCNSSPTYRGRRILAIYYVKQIKTVLCHANGFPDRIRDRLHDAVSRCRKQCGKQVHKPGKYEAQQRLWNMCSPISASTKSA